MNLIRVMQVLGVSSFFGCVFCMFLLFVGLAAVAQAVFVASQVMLMVSLALSVWEIRMSVGALNLLQALEEARSQQHSQRERLGERVKRRFVQHRP